MSRREELEKEVEFSLEKIKEFCELKLKKYKDSDLEKEAHLMGIDIIHDACHTLRGRLPKTEVVSLPAMKKLWTT